MITATEFQGRVLDWFEVHGRHDLPWQQDQSPYRVWLSEIMLQQTQVTTVIPYFERFTATYPTVEALAGADEDSVLHLWTGLGYYARARNLLKCARTVCDEFGGQFPATIEELETLPGIGRSTAGAIASMAFGRPAAILDGNVKRVLARYAAIPGWPGQTAVHKELWALAEELSPVERCRDYTQAMMDLGATLCLRRKPDCQRCPLQDACQGHALGREEDFPGRKPRREKPVRSTTMLIICDPQGDVFLSRRPDSGIWGGLWSFPEVEDRGAATPLVLDRFRAEPESVTEWEPLRHTFSHYHLDIQPLHIRLGQTAAGVGEAEDQLWFSRRQPQAIGMAAPVARLLKQLDNEVNP